MWFSVGAVFLLQTVVLVRGFIPDDAAVRWPSPAEVAAFGKTLNGEVFFPESEGYLNGSAMMNSRYNSQFGVVVMVENTADVQKSILFCKKYGIRPTVKCSGHDYIGRSAGTHTFSINLNRLNTITDVVRDDRSETKYSLQLEPAIAFVKVYKHVHDQGYLFQGGSAHTVTPGGYTLGGGHGPMSRMLGLGLDNVIEFTLVTPDGSIIKMTKNGGKITRPGSSTEEDYNDPDLFWSVRGGGGGTYGVVTRYTFQVHQPPSGGFCQLSIMYPLYHSTQGNVGEKVLRFWSDYMLNKLTDEWGGMLLFSGQAGSMNASDPRAPTFQGTLNVFLLHFGSCIEGKPAVDALLNMYPEYQVFAVSIPYASFWDYEKNIANDEVGYRNYIIDRLLQPEDLQPNSKLPEVLSQMAKIPEVAPQVGCTWMTLGGKVSKYPTESSSASPDLRTAIGAISCGIVWLYPRSDDKNIKALRDYSKKLYTIGKGVYYNEPDYYLENWKEEYWGSQERYDRLLKTKIKYDPDNMFWCHHCVGEDLEKNTSLGAKIIPPSALLLIIYSIFSSSL